MKRTVKEIATEYGKGWEIRVFDSYENYLYTATTDEILIGNDEKFELVVNKIKESTIYIHLLYVTLI